jgi:hypothetical protein
MPFDEADDFISEYKRFKGRRTWPFLLVQGQALVYNHLYSLPTASTSFTQQMRMLPNINLQLSLLLVTSLYLDSGLQPQPTSISQRRIEQNPT